MPSACPSSGRPERCDSQRPRRRLVRAGRCAVSRFAATSSWKHEARCRQRCWPDSIPWSGGARRARPGRLRSPGGARVRLGIHRAQPARPPATRPVRCRRSGCRALCPAGPWRMSPSVVRVIGVGQTPAARVEAHSSGIDRRDREDARCCSGERERPPRARRGQSARDVRERCTAHESLPSGTCDRTFTFCLTLLRGVWSDLVRLDSFVSHS